MPHKVEMMSETVATDAKRDAPVEEPKADETMEQQQEQKAEEPQEAEKAEQEGEEEGEESDSDDDGEDEDGSEEEEGEEGEGEAAEEEEAPLPEGMGADELFARGEELRRAKQWGDATRYYCGALEQRLKEVDGVDGHQAAAHLYLAYADALLTQEEHCHELFNWDGQVKEKKAGGESTAEKKEDEDGVDDLQLAWENLEMARVAYKKRIAMLESNGKEVPKKEIEDASWVHVRLGDLLLLQEKAEEAALEYREAAEMRGKYKFPYSEVISIFLSMGQAYGFADKNGEALEALGTADRLITDYLKGKDGLSPPAERRKDFEATAQEIRDSIIAMQQKLAADAEHPETATAEGSTVEALKVAKEAAKQLAEAQKGSSAFDAPSANAAPAVVVSSANAVEIPVAGAEGEEGKKKKRRIEITQPPQQQ